MAIVAYLTALICSGAVVLGGKIGVSVLRWDDGRPFGAWFGADAIHVWWTKVKPMAYSWQYIPDDPPTFLDRLFLPPLQNGVDDAPTGVWRGLWQEGHMTVEDAFVGKSYLSPATGVQISVPLSAGIVFACLIAIGCVGIARWLRTIISSATPKTSRFSLSRCVLVPAFICSMFLLATISVAWRGAMRIQPHMWFIGQSRSAGIVANYSSIVLWNLDSSIGRNSLFDRSGIPGPSSGEGFDLHAEFITIAQHHLGAGSVCSLAIGQFDNREGSPISVSPPVGWVAEIPYWLPTTALSSLVAALFAAILILKLRSRRRPLDLKCPSCGYDIRVNSGRCPECGVATV